MNIDDPILNLIKENPMLNSLYNLLAHHGANQLNMFSDICKTFHQVVNAFPEPVKQEAIDKLIELLQSMKAQQPPQA